MRWTYLVAGALVLAAAAAPAPAQILLGVSGNKSGSPGDLFRVDPATGELTPIQDVLTAGGLSGLAVTSSGRIYATSVSGPLTTSTLVELNPLTGEVLVTVGVVTTTTAGAVSIGDLAVQPGTDALFGIRSNADGGNGGGEIYFIDPADAVATLVGQSDPAGIGGGLAFAPDSTLWRTGGSGPAYDVYELRKLDPGDASTVEVTLTGLSDYYDGLAVHPGTGLVYATDRTGIVVIDPLAGTETTLAPGPAFSLSDLAFASDIVPAVSTTWGRLKRMYGGGTSGND